jgi:adenine-specific DNA-methyltransferase
MSSFIPIIIRTISTPICNIPDRRTAKVVNLGTNAETSGRYHTNWLNMMYPRLKLARNLLRDDGVIFISIDDNEVANLRKLCDEIFGEENFRAQISWQKKYSVSNNFKGIASVRDFIIVYSKSEKFENGFLPEQKLLKIGIKIQIMIQEALGSL